jgi:hypothetical protein
MPATASVDLNKADVKALFDAINRSSKETSRSMRSSLTWGGLKLASSLGAQTIRGKKLRKVIKNPDKRSKTDGRRANFGVMKLFQDRGGKFIPIFRTGQHGDIRFKNKKTATWFTVDSTGRVSRELATGAGEFQLAGIMQSPRRKIGRRGFAAKSWKFLQQRMKTGGSIFIDGKPNMGEVIWSGGKDDPTVTINNRVSYMPKALRGGTSAIGNAMSAATAGMVYQLDNKIRKKMGVK